MYQYNRCLSYLVICLSTGHFQCPTVQTHLSQMCVRLTIFLKLKNTLLWTHFSSFILFFLFTVSSKLEMEMSLLTALLCSSLTCSELPKSLFLFLLLPSITLLSQALLLPGVLQHLDNHFPSLVLLLSLSNISSKQLSKPSPVQICLLLRGCSMPDVQALCDLSLAQCTSHIAPHCSPQPSCAALVVIILQICSPCPHLCIVLQNP